MEIVNIILTIFSLKKIGSFCFKSDGIFIEIMVYVFGKIFQNTFGFS